MANYALAIDVGGTFTDVVLSNLDTGDIHLVKVPSTPSDPSLGFMEGLRKVLEESGIHGASLRRIFHGTTIATNAILEGKGTTVGLIVSEGFKYVLEIARQGMPRLASTHVWVKPERPVPPERIFEVAERIDFTGETVVPLDEEAVLRSARHFAGAGIDSIAVSFLHSYADSANERRARDLVMAFHPQAHVSLSSEVLPVFREYERTMTTVLNAYVMPQVSYYVKKLEGGLKESGIDAPLLIMKSSGGVIGVETAVRQPVYTALSGPAAGVMAARHFGQMTGFKDVISLDMGGTSTDVSLISDCNVTSTTEGRLGDWPMHLPMVDITTIGAGGGSIAWLTQSGNLSLGPHSAGANPGPVCYGQGGTEPTVTDANLVLGRINTSIAGGAVALDLGAARDALQEKIAAPLDLSLEEAASGITMIVNNSMMGAIRNVSVERGYDPREFTLVAFGGAGPMHAVGVAQLLGIPNVLVPRNPGVSSAHGLLVADFKNDYARTFIQKPPDYDLEAMEKVYKELEEEALYWLDQEGVPQQGRSLLRSADMRYTHQGFEVATDLKGGSVDEESFEGLLDEFHRRHKQLFGFSLDQPVEVVTLRVSAVGTLGGTRMPRLTGKPVPAEKAVKEQRPVFFQEQGAPVLCDIFTRGMLSPDSVVQGPSILEGMDSTVVINPGWQGRIDEYGNCILQAVPG